MISTEQANRFEVAEMIYRDVEETLQVVYDQLNQVHFRGKLPRHRIQVNVCVLNGCSVLPDLSVGDGRQEFVEVDQEESLINIEFTSVQNMLHALVHAMIHVKLGEALGGEHSAGFKWEVVRLHGEGAPVSLSRKAVMESVD